MATFTDLNMLVFLSISQPKLTAKDAQASIDIALVAGANKESVAAVKKLYAKDDYASIRNIVTAARKEHQLRTAAWIHKGYNILSSKGFMDYSESMRKLHTAFDLAVDEFVDGYAERLDRAKDSLNGLYRPEDYPSPDEIRSKFRFSVDYAPIPTAGDFRVEGLNQDSVDEIQNQINIQKNEAIKVAMADVINRVRKMVGTIQGNILSKETAIKESTYDRMVELAEILPTLNVANDPKLDEVINDIKSDLAGRTRDDLNKDGAPDCENIIDKMDAMASLYGC